ncbi:3-carboxy-cis,cis-muconate cycloisomerase [Nocardiopsis sp. CNT312]|uniref:3-carboxy-cis,cis-muconate cycloisomerase n=1 Tax=Nocardiopsis sp. CNT312 TaxID=1137268 RepID=UPI0004906C4B|nr:3-carboxy-cis,cis-muconate cycloisomerase [Nocardiopsis sp. CNT312]
MSPDAPAADALDTGLLDPGRAGSAVEAATGDTAFLAALLEAEAALTLAQADLGLAPGEAARAVAEAADPARFDARDLALRARGGGNPVIPLVADLTAAVAAEHAPYVHRGATSQDIMDTAAMLVAKRALEPVLADLASTVRALADLAARHRATPMAGRTLTQQAVPTTFGLKAAGWRSLAAAAERRLAAARATLPVQLGGAAGTMAAFVEYADGDPGTGPMLLTAYARRTGLAEPRLPWHVLRAPVADLGTALAFTAGALGKVAADVLVLSRTEIGEVAEGSGGGSSAMPHKSNPVRATLIAAAARRLPALASVLLSALACEDERPAGAWHAEWQTLREALRVAGGAAREAAELTAGLRVDPERMARNLALTGGRVTAERITSALSPVVGRGRAKELLAEASRDAAEEGLPLAEALSRLPELSELSRGDLDGLTDPAAYLGSAPALVDRALAPEGPRDR